ncbi:MAG: adenylate/guanylate cyclase domain-containing protein, partial [Kiloniellales bacterium]
YMCVGGLPSETRSHDIHACLAALEMRDAVARINRNRGKIGLDPWEIRIGLHSGPVMAGVIGQRRWSYDIWGNAVNVAASMERHSEAGRINVSQSTGDSVAKFFDLEPRGMVEIKNKGQVGMCFLNGINREYSKDSDGLLPNEALREILGR